MSYTVQCAKVYRPGERYNNGAGCEAKHSTLEQAQAHFSACVASAKHTGELCAIELRTADLGVIACMGHSLAQAQSTMLRAYNESRVRA